MAPVYFTFEVIASNLLKQADLEQIRANLPTGFQVSDNPVRLLIPFAVLTPPPTMAGRAIMKSSAAVLAGIASYFALHYLTHAALTSLKNRVSPEHRKTANRVISFLGAAALAASAFYFTGTKISTESTIRLLRWARV